MSNRQIRRRWLATLALLALAAAPPGAALEPPSHSALASRVQFHPDLAIENYFQPPAALPAALATALRLELQSLGAPDQAGFYDLRGGRWGTLVLSAPLVPGPGNGLQWAGAAPADDEGYRQALWAALADYLAAHGPQLRLAAPQLAAGPRITLHENRRVAQIYVPRSVGGVRVRDSFLVAAVNAGNLVLLGTRNWGDIDAPTTAALPATQAIERVRAHVAPATVAGFWGEAELELVPLARGDSLAEVVPGAGYTYRLAWSIKPRIAGDDGSYEVLVDARSGELLLFGDRNQYADRKSVGGINPVSNDGLLPDGVEYPGFPMPFADLKASGSPAGSTNAHGLVGASGFLETQLVGPFVRINDSCGVIAETTLCGELDLGASGGTDCATPAGHSAGDTHSARTGFYEVNRIIGQAKAYRPGAPWLDAQLTANMNLNNTCNAFWNGSTINFYRQGPHSSGTFSCRNTGEIAAVFDHEWGHGLDNNDNIPEVSLPGEAYADIAAVYRLNQSCIARGFLEKALPSGNPLNCGGNGDPCLECSGVREIDWAKRQSGRPHDIDWTLGLNPDIPGSCVFIPDPGELPNIPVLQTGPCMLGTHCEGTIVGEAFWDLYTRDLQGFAGSPFQLDPNSALEVATHLYYLGANNVAFWYQCIGQDSGLGGCNADGGYLNLLAVDDDNGNLLDGTPHMAAIHRAFDRHQLSCNGLPVATSGCAGGPAVAPALNATALERGAQLGWSAVPGASEYWVYRTDGIFGFDFGKERIAITAATVYLDEGLLDGFAYHYGVLAVGAGGCLGPMSAGVEVVAPAPAPVTADLGIDYRSASFAAAAGDGDEFVDNCERGELRFLVGNTGEVPLTNVRITSAHSPSHPETLVLSPLPKPVAASLAVGCAAQPPVIASLDIVPGGVGPGETLEIEVALTADQLAAPATALLRLAATEGDWTLIPSRTYRFESGFDNWQVVSGTVQHVPAGGADGSNGYVATTGVTDECAQVRSPSFRLTPSSSLALFTQYSTEPFSDSWFDRANVALFDLAAESRTTIVPDGGRLYAASGPNGFCVTNGQPGWATDLEGDTGLTWAPSTFSAAAVGGAALAGREVALDIAYGIDQLVSSFGFWFDELTLTDFEERGPDAQSDACPLLCDQVDDSSPAIEYAGGWHRVEDAAASGGGYHRRMGNNKNGAAARVVFTGPEITYFFGRSDKGGTAEVYLDGELRETISYLGATKAVSFGHSATYTGLGQGSHELRIVHRGGAVYVDGFRLNCAGGGGASTAAVRSRSVTESSAASAGEGPLFLRSVTVGAADLELSVVVEGSPVALGVQLLDAAGSLLATGGALIPGSTATGLDLAAPQPGTYTVKVVNSLPPLGTAKISIARTVRVP